MVRPLAAARSLIVLAASVTRRVWEVRVHPSITTLEKTATTLALLVATLVGTTPALSGPHRLPDAIRRGERGAFLPPPGATEVPPGGSERRSFSPIVDEIVAEFSALAYDTRLRQLSGDVPVLVGGSGYTFHTRHSFSEGGRKSGQWAHEQLVALGLSVRDQEYTWNGNVFRNVIVTIPGETTPERVYVLGGHIDSISPQPDALAPGAEDNASGSSGVMAAAQALLGRHFASTIELVLFSGEEQGLWGSDHYVEEALGLGVDLRAAVILDMIAYVDDDYGVLIEGEPAWADLMDAYGDAVARYTGLASEYTYTSWGSDHVPFQDANVPAILALDLDWSDYPWYHSTGDTYDKTMPALGVEIARAALATIAQLAGPLSSSSALDPLAQEFGPSGEALVAVPNPAAEFVRFRLLSPAPGPVGMEESAPGSLPGDGRRLTVVDVQGRIVWEQPFPATGRAIEWDLRGPVGHRLPPGVYFARTGSATRRIVITR